VTGIAIGCVPGLAKSPIADAKFIRGHLIYAYTGMPGAPGAEFTIADHLNGCAAMGSNAGLQSQGEMINARTDGDDRLICHVLGRRPGKQAERMACRVREDPPATGIDVKQPATQTENLRLGPVEVGDLDVEVKLLRVRGIRPPRPAVIIGALECQH